MQNFVPALLRLSARPHYWRIAVILPGRILWRTYSRVEYPTPDDAVRRCLAGLVGSSHQQHEPCPRAAGQNHKFAPVAGHGLPFPCAVQPQTGQGPEECRHGHAEPQHRLPAVEGDEATQHPRPLSHVRVRVAWWGWL